MPDGRLVMIEWEGRRRPRLDVIRELFDAGVPVADIARRLGVRYQIVYMAVRGQTRPGNADRRGDLTSPLTEPDAILVGCVSQKNTDPAPAKDLYRSELFRRRRLWAEASHRPWWIVSAEYGLVAPDEVIAPYDTRIAALPAADRAKLGRGVADRLESEIGPLQGKVFELHAGDEYFLAVAPELRRRGAAVGRPLEGLRIGEQLGWYGDHLQLERTTGGAQVRRRPTRSAASMIGHGRGLSQVITELFVSGGIDLSSRQGAPAPGWGGMPEVVATTRLHQLGASAAELRLFLTFAAAMDRARDADVLARRAVRMFEAAPWTFAPAEVSRRTLRDLTDALKEFGVSQRHSVDVFGWRTLAETLNDPSLAPESRAAIHDGRADARRLTAELASTTKQGTPCFPLLSGPKVSALWVRLLAFPGGATITSMETVPVAVDVQVRKVTEYLAVTDTGDLDLIDARSPIQETWARDVDTHGAAGPEGVSNTPGALDPALWFYGKWGCTFCESAGRKLPISPVCGDCRFPIRSADAAPGAWDEPKPAEQSVGRDV